MERPPFTSCCHLFASGKAAFVVHRTISSIYRHHRLVEHECSSAMKSMVGHFTGDHCQARQDPAGGQEACYLEPRWFRTQRSVSLISWKPVAPRNTLLLLEMAFSLEFKTPCLLDPPSPFPGVQCYHHMASPTLRCFSADEALTPQDAPQMNPLPGSPLWSPH